MNILSFSDPDEDLLYVTDLDLLYLKKFLQMIETIPAINVELYMWWTTVYAMIINTSTDVVDYVIKQIDSVTPSTGSVVRTKSVLKFVFMIDLFCSR